MKVRPALDELVEGPVIAIDKSAVYINLAPYGTGIIYGREYIAVRDLVKKDKYWRCHQSQGCRSRKR